MWLYQVPCRFGHIGVWGENLLSAYASGRLMTGRLASLPGVRVVQRGDDEVQVTFTPDLLPEVALCSAHAVGAGSRTRNGHGGLTSLFTPR